MVKQLNVRVPVEIYNHFKMLCLKDNVSMQQAINNYIVSCLKSESTELPIVKKEELS